MPPTSETDLQELKELILGLDKRLDGLDQKVEIQGVKLDALNQRLDDLKQQNNQRFDDLKEQINKQDNRFWGLVLALFVALLGIMSKVLFFPSQPV